MKDNYFAHEIDDIGRMYGEVCEWFDSLGFTYVKTRYGKYKSIFDEFSLFTENKVVPENIQDFNKRFDNAYLEVHEAIRVYNGLKYLDQPEFIEQLKKVLSGQEYRAMSDNDQARDFLFELSVATRFIKAGYEVSLTNVCDVVVDMKQEGVLFVECKRVKSINKLAKNVKKANSQLTKRIQKTGRPNAIGLVAVNITDLLPKSDYLQPDSNESGTQIHRLKSRKVIFENVLDLMSGKTNDCMGVMCESLMMNYFSSDSNLNGFQCSRHTDHIPYHDSPLYEALSKQLSYQDIV